MLYFTATNHAAMFVRSSQEKRGRKYFVTASSVVFLPLFLFISSSSSTLQPRNILKIISQWIRRGWSPMQTLHNVPFHLALRPLLDTPLCSSSLILHLSPPPLLCPVIQPHWLSFSPKCPKLCPVSVLLTHSSWCRDYPFSSPSFALPHS